jgi:transcriptional regulator GlxA family with amidase domain
VGREVRVGIVAVPDATVGTLSGIFDVLNGLGFVGAGDGVTFRVEILGETADPVALASGLTLPIHGAVGEPGYDIAIVPSLLVPATGWSSGRYPSVIEWLRATHRAGGTICSACSGLFLIAETGLFNGVEATVHWPYAPLFRAQNAAVIIRPEQALMISGERGELISSGASTSWHDLVLYLIAREAGTVAAQTMAKMFALQRHVDGLASFMMFDPPKDHGDALIADAQAWLESHCALANPVREAVARSGLPERSFSRRFKAATGLAPLDYVQRLRVEQAKRRLERTTDAVETIAWQVGYEEPAAFRRIFQRVTGMAPGRYRRQFSLPMAAG